MQVGEPESEHRDRRYGAHGDSFAAFRDYPRKTKRVIPVVVLDWNFCEKEFTFTGDLVEGEITIVDPAN